MIYISYLVYNKFKNFVFWKRNINRPFQFQLQQCKNTHCQFGKIRNYQPFKIIHTLCNVPATSNYPFTRKFLSSLKLISPQSWRFCISVFIGKESHKRRTLLPLCKFNWFLSEKNAKTKIHTNRYFSYKFNPQF